MIPRPADCFQDREVFERVQAIAGVGGTLVLAQAGFGAEAPAETQVLAGMGGVGKTQLAAAYARQAWRQGVEVLVWVNAATRDGVVSAYADAALRLNLPMVGRDDPEQRARELLTWAEDTDRRWLIVLDDVHHPGDLQGWWPPAAASPAGQVLVTTRLRDAALAGADRRILDVGTFTRAEARSYLTAKLGAQGPVADMDGLAADLGFLPLALAQAAAYVRNADITCAAYRHRLATRLLAHSVPGRDYLPDDHQRIVTAAWELSIDHADHADPALPVGLARQVLYLASVLDPAGIPQAVLAGPPALDFLTAQQRPSSPATRLIAGGVGVDADMVDAALRVLHRHSLLDHNRVTTHREIRIHQLVQRATRENLLTQPDLGPAPLAEIARTAADALLRLWPQIERDQATQQLGQILRANTTALHDCTSSALYSPDSGAHAVLFQAATSLAKTGRTTAAVTANTDLHANCLHHLGPDHPDTLTTRSNLAILQGVVGDAVGAVAAFEELLAHQLRVLEPDHPDTLTTRHRLALWRGNAGDDVGAVAAFEELLADRTRMLGADHPDTLITRSNVTRWRYEAGHVSGSATYSTLEELLTDFLRVLGPDHRATLSVRHLMAWMRDGMGDVDGAAAEYEKLLTEYLRVLGPDHNRTLITRRNLARLRVLAGDATGAVTAFIEVLADRLRVNGSDHPDTLFVRHDVAWAQGEAGDAVAAVTAFEQVLADQLRVLGPDHPHTQWTRGALAYWRGEAGDAVGAATAYTELLANRLRMLGRDHPDTLSARHEVAWWRGEAGDADGAVTAFEQLLADRTRVLGPDHPDTLANRHDLACWRGEAGDAAGAATALQELLTKVGEVLGPDHPDTLLTRGNLAWWHGETGNAVAAVTAFEQLLTDRIRVLGSDDPQTLSTRDDLAHWRKKAEAAE
ncbi:tetratricopeptide repeat protein [Actinomadura sp. KC216]|nr:tetratricopeptide repeat protein [Actinomadura sp. KC216]